MVGTRQRTSKSFFFMIPITAVIQNLIRNGLAFAVGDTYGFDVARPVPQHKLRSVLSLARGVYKQVPSLYTTSALHPRQPMARLDCVPGSRALGIGVGHVIRADCGGVNQIAYCAADNALLQVGIRQRLLDGEAGEMVKFG